MLNPIKLLEKERVALKYKLARKALLIQDCPADSKLKEMVERYSKAIQVLHIEKRKEKKK